MPPNSAVHQQYDKVNHKRKDIFLAMFTNTEYYKYKPLSVFPTIHIDAYYCCDDKSYEINHRIFNMNIRSGIDNTNMISHILRCYETDEIIIKPSVDRKNNDNDKQKYITLNQEYESNERYHFDLSLLNMIHKEAAYYQSNKSNKHFITEDVTILIIFLKFPSFRMLLNQYLLQPKSSNFDHFYAQLCAVHFAIDITENTKTGYSIFNSQILSTAPILFSKNLKNIFNVSTITNNKYQGIICRVIVSGKFVSLSMFGDEFSDIFIVILPTNIQIMTDEQHHNVEEEAKQFRDILELDEFIDDELLINVQTKFQIIQHLMTNRLLVNLVSLFHDFQNWEQDLLCDMYRLFPNPKTMLQFLFNIKIITNIKALCCNIWLEFINDNSICNTSILRLRRICQQIEQEQALSKSGAQIPGKLLLEYTRNDILSQVADDIQWETYIKHYISIHVAKLRNEQISSIHAESNKQQRSLQMRNFLDIMTQYHNIINMVKDDHYDDDEKKTVEDDQEAPDPQLDHLDMDELMNLFQIVDKQFNMSQLMDIVNYIKRGGIGEMDFKEIEMENYKCKLKNACNILMNDIETRKQQLLSRVLRSRNDNNYLNLSIRDYCKMELLNFAHIRLFHDYYKQNETTNDIISSQLEFESELFVDKLYVDNILLRLYCEENEFDTEAMYHDICRDNDAQSFICCYFKRHLKHEMKQYYVLKEHITNYTIHPSDETAMTRTLIALDFGDHVTDWNVKPKYANMKQEWMENEYFPIGTDLYQSLYINSKIIGDTKLNKSNYNLSISNILCIKMYTDTTKLQSNFRHAFRTSSDRNRRSQFIHWATNLNITFIKVEMANELYGSNQYICNTTLFHGLNRLFDTKPSVQQFNGPLSTTWDSSVAQTTFAGDNGMVLEIDKDTNNKNTKAIEVEWISCHITEKEVLLMNPKVIIKKATIFSKDTELKSTKLKRILSSIHENRDISYLQSSWIATCLEDVIKDKEFIKRVQLFLPQKCLDGMNLCQYIFFKCKHYQIATYINKYSGKSEKEIFEMIIDSALFSDFIDGDNNKWIQSVNRSPKFSSKYPPRMCVMNVIFEYDDKHKICKNFTTKQGKRILKDPNLLLQYIDQRNLYKYQKGVTIDITMNTKYQHQFDDGDKSQVRKWRGKLNFKVKIGNYFNWRIIGNTTFTCDSLYVSSLWVTNYSVMKHDICDNKDEKVSILCQENIYIDENGSIVMMDKNVVILCATLIVKGLIKGLRLARMFIVANRTNISTDNLQQKFNSYKLVEFAYIKETQTQSKKYKLEYHDIKHLDINYDQKEHVQLYSYDSIERMPLIEFNDIEAQCKYLKSELLSLMIEDKKYHIQENKVTIFDSIFSRKWVRNCLKTMIKDEKWIQNIRLFSPRHYLKGMNLFEFIFFRCKYYEIATYINDCNHLDVDKNELFDIIISKDFFHKYANTWIQGFDRSQRLCGRYPPTICEMNIVYEYDDNNKIYKKFKGNEAKEMLMDTNLILQYIDQRILSKLQKQQPSSSEEWKGLTIYLRIDIQYGHQWKYKVSAFKFEVGKSFSWKMDYNSMLTVGTLYVSSLWVHKACNVSLNKINNGYFTIICEKDIIIDENSSISMNECGAKGAFYDDENKTFVYQMDCPCNGKSGDKFGGGAGYKSQGQNGVDQLNKIDGNGGDKFVVNHEDDEYKTFSVGFGGGCSKYGKGSKGGNGGGRIIILSDKLTIHKGGRITSNGGNGVQYGGGGSGGSILIITNDMNVNENNINKKLTVKGGKGDKGGGNGSDGVIQFGYINQSINDIVCHDMFNPTQVKTKFDFDKESLEIFNEEKCNDDDMNHQFEMERDDDHDKLKILQSKLVKYEQCPSCNVYGNKRNQALIPCGHLICNQCANEILCPICQGFVEDRFTLNID